MSTVINLRGITRVYKNTVKALDGVDLSIEDGDYISILGESGSGKSTLMNIIGCLDKCDGGEYLFCGENIATFSENKFDNIRREHIGFVFQRFCLIPSLTAFDNIELPLIYSHIPKQKRKAMVETALETVGLSNRKNHRPNELSGGQQQRVAIARAIVKNPPIILADEPTGNLDPKNASEISSLFDKLNRNGKTVILITHDEKIAKSAKRSVVIKSGRIY